jgi:hypothetical protein
VRQFAEDHQHHQAEHEPGDDRLGQELRHPADAEEAGDEHGQPAGQRQRGRVRRARAVPATPKLARNEPESTETVDTGPTTSWREEPKTAYATRASGTAYRPTWTGAPAIDA